MTGSRGRDHSAYTLIRGGYVLTLDPHVGELASGDVLIDDNLIVEVAPRIDPPAPQATVIDAEHMMVMPGLVDNHRHLWVSLLRGFSVDHSFGDYFAQVLLAISPRLTPEDVHLGCLLGAYEALDTGVTTILDWNHGCYSREHAIAAVQALRESGIRALLGYSSPATEFMQPDGQPTAADLAAVRQATDDDQLLGLAVATRNPETADEAGLRRIAEDIGLAREWGVPVTLHTGFGRGRSAPRWLHDQELLGPDMTLVHGNAFTADDLRLVAAAEAWMAISPETELQMGLGAPPLRAMLDAGLRPTVSVDVVAAAAGDLRTQLRLLLQTQRMLDHAAGRTGPLLPSHTVLPYVTAHAAASLGLASEIGTLAPGRRADLVLVDRSHPSIAPIPSAVAAALAAPASAVDTVLVAGRTVKRGGRLLDADLRQLRHRVEAARHRLLG